MNDVMALLKDRRAKAEGKVARAIKALDLAKKELSDLQAAERVMSGITGESLDNKAGGASSSDRDKEMAKLLEVGSDSAISPIDLYPLYVEASGDNVNLDTFRTALWRLTKKTIQDDERVWVVKSENGKYWRETAPEIDDFDELLG